MLAELLRAEHANCSCALPLTYACCTAPAKACGALPLREYNRAQDMSYITAEMPSIRGLRKLQRRRARRRQRCHHSRPLNRLTPLRWVVQGFRISTALAALTVSGAIVVIRPVRPDAGQKVIIHVHHRAAGDGGAGRARVRALGRVRLLGGARGRLARCGAGAAAAAASGTCRSM